MATRSNMHRSGELQLSVMKVLCTRAGTAVANAQKVNDRRKP